jgi:hypothetical protein
MNEKICSQPLVAHVCNPSYSGGREQEDHGLKPARANSLTDPISENLITGLGLWLSGRTLALLMCEALGLIPQHHKNKQTNKKNLITKQG